MKHNVVKFEDLKKGKTLARVVLNSDLEPESILDAVEELVYRKGWKGSIIEIEPKGNHKDFLPVLFDEYEFPVWIDKKYLEQE